MSQVPDSENQGLSDRQINTYFAEFGKEINVINKRNQGLVDYCVAQNQSYVAIYKDKKFCAKTPDTKTALDKAWWWRKCAQNMASKDVEVTQEFSVELYCFICCSYIICLQYAYIGIFSHFVALLDCH